MKIVHPPLETTQSLPVSAPCEHIAGNERFIIKGFSLQEQFTTVTDTSLVDLTLDLEDGAPVGQEETLRRLCVDLLNSDSNKADQAGVRIHPITSPHALRDLEVLITKAGSKIRYITVPKINSVRDVRWARGLIDFYCSEINLPKPIPLHLLIETHSAVNQLSSIAKLPLIETFDFGLMDFISQFDGAIAASAMRSPEQFSHPLISATKQHISRVAIEHQIVPSHNVTVDIRDSNSAYADARKARREYGFLRMWSIHPNQIQSIIQGMLPDPDEIEEAKEILEKASCASWGPIEHNNRLHDRASYRYYWNILRRSPETHSLQ